MRKTPVPFRFARHLRRLGAGYLAGGLMLCPAIGLAQDAPSLETLEAFAQVERLVETEPAQAFALADDLLATEATPELRLIFARYALEAGDHSRAIAYGEPALRDFESADPAATEMFDLLSAAYLALGERESALRYALLAFNAAERRVGPESPLLIPRLDALEPQLAILAPALLPDLREQRRTIEQAATREASTRALDPHAVTVWYGTNRNRQQNDDPATAYGHRLGPLSVGRMTVTIPPNHQSGLIEQPSGWSLTPYWDPEEHVVLADMQEIAEDVFAADCCTAQDRLLFIHGYNVSFHDGALRAAQLSFDLEFKGDMLYYSWPSKASLFGYLSDANKVLPTRASLSRFLEMATRGPGRLHIIAHSMGNRYALSALDAFVSAYPERELGHLILAAPDVDRDALSAYFDKVAPQASSVTLYTSRNDLALKISRRVNGGMRAGDARGVPLLLDGMDTVDASDITADMLGHSYFGDAPQMLADILGLVELGQTPGQRCAVLPDEGEEGANTGASFWRVQENGCNIAELRVATTLTRLHGETALTVGRQKREDAGGDQQDFWNAVIDLLGDRLPDAAPKE